jgi:hypothetical protein
MGPRHVNFNFHGAEWAPRLEVHGAKGAQGFLGVVA